MSKIVNPNGTSLSTEDLKDFNVAQLIEETKVQQSYQEMQIAKVVGESLVRTYPNRQWGVQIDIDGGMAIVTCPSLSVAKGFHIALDGKNVIELVEAARRGAGEILERYGISRRRNISSDIVENLIVHPVTGESVIESDSTKGEEPIKRGR